MTELIVDKIRKVDNPLQAQRAERKSLINTIETLTKCTVVVLYHNLRSPVSMLDDTDADMLEGVLQVSPVQRPLLLILNSNGGLPLAAERVVHVARVYAPRGFRTMVVQKAKSAATMVCLGSDHIYMTTTAELGPIDPQIFGYDRSRRISVDSYLEAYDSLMTQLKDIDMDAENPTGLLHQLDRFDAAHVVEMRKVRELGRDITSKLLARHMMAGKSASEIEATVKKFSESAEHKAHGRPIWAPEALNAGLKITTMRQNTQLWNASYELLARYDHLCQLNGMMRQEHTTKLLETSHTSHRSSEPLEEDT